MIILLQTVLQAPVTSDNCISEYVFVENKNKSPQLYLTIIIPQTRVGYEMIDSQRGACAELAIIISYPTSVSGIIVLLKTIKKYC